MQRVICETMRKQSVREEEAAPYVSAFLPFVSVPVSGVSRLARAVRGPARSCTRRAHARGTGPCFGLFAPRRRRLRLASLWVSRSSRSRRSREPEDQHHGFWGLGRHVAKTSVFRRDAAVAQCLTRADATTRARPLHNSTLLNSTIVSIHTLFDDHESTTATSTNPKSIPLEAHAPPQHLILRAL